MITGKIEHLSRYISLFPEIAQLEAFTRTKPIETLGEKTSYQDISLIPLVSPENPAFDETLLEAHRTLMDIHITLEGEDRMAYADLAGETTPHKDYDEANDYLLVRSDRIKTLAIPAGYFCIVPNTFAHMALYGTGEGIRKVVVKIPAKD